MTGLQPETPDANTSERDAAEKTADRFVAEAARAVAGHAIGTGVAAEIAARCRGSPLEAEIALRDILFIAGREVLANTYERPAGHGGTVEAGGETYRKTAATTGRAMTLFGEVLFQRSRYRPSGPGASVVPVESVIGLTEGGLTPAAASLSMYFMSTLTARESEEAWERTVGTGPSAASLVRLSAEAGSCMEECSDELLAELREQEEVPEDAVSVLVGLDGVMLRMNGETEDGGTGEAGWREAASGVVALADREGTMLEARCFGRLPEAGKKGLKSQLMAEAMHWLARKPGLKLSAVADGARDNWTFLEALEPEVMILDFLHAVQHLKVATDAAFGPDTAAGTAWFEKQRHTLRHDPKGAGKVIDALRYLKRKGKGKGKGAGDIERELACFRNNRHRMDCAGAAANGFAIGSGAVEAANKTLVTVRMKRSGQRWGRDGGQGVLAFRALLRSGRFDRAWAVLAPRLKRSGGWEPPQSANENRTAAQVARAA